MKARFSVTLFFLGVITIPLTAFAMTEETFTIITSDTTWSRSGSPYVVNYVTVQAGATLTVEPGVVIKVAHDNYPFIVNGTLILGMQDSEPVVITALSDDTYGGDTNGDGVATVPMWGDWRSIDFNTGSVGNFSNAIILYGGGTPFSPWIGGRLTFPLIENYGGVITIDKSFIAHGYYGIRQTDGALFMTDCDVSDTTFGVHVMGGVTQIHGSRFHENSEYGVYTNSALGIDARGNWWGHPLGPRTSTNPFASVEADRVSDGVEYAGWLVSPTVTAPPTPPCTENCNSNVLFFPGILGSRLFEDDTICSFSGGEMERWVSLMECNQKRLALDVSGKSLYSLYTKEGMSGVIDEAYTFNLYKSFMNDMERWKENGVFADYALIPYDWRLSLEDVLQNGASTTDSKLSFGVSQGFKNSYIYQKLTELQNSSRTGRVTIIAHSNGGLVTKALINKLHEINDPLYDKIDKVIFVAVPQLGTPEAVTNILHGDEIAPLGIVMSGKRFRSLAGNMPGAYQLLPSANYFSSSGATVETPLVTFEDGTATLSFISRYGNTISDIGTLQSFLRGEDGRRAPAYEDNENPAVLSSSLLASATEAHNQIDDNWQFSPNTTIYQIAGWGEKTLASVNYRTVPKCNRFESVIIEGRENIYCASWGSELTFDPIEVIDGDGTVVVPSALAMSTSTERVKRYWVDLDTFNKPILGINRVHKDILEIAQLRQFIASIMGMDNSISSLIHTSRPGVVLENSLVFTLHSPLSLEFIDLDGQHIGLSTSTPNSMDMQIKGARYKRYGEVQVLSIPKSTSGTLILRGIQTGSFTLDIAEMNGVEKLSETSFEGIPSSTSTIATMNISPDVSPTAFGDLNVDADGDGTADETLTSEIGGTVTTDKTPPEAKISFSTSTRKLEVGGIDAGKTGSIISTSTITIYDTQGNTLHVPLSAHKEKNQAILLIFNSLIYNGSVNPVATTTIKHKWNTNKRGEITMLASYIKSGTSTIETHYRPKTGQTIIMTMATEIDDDEENDNEVDRRQIKKKAGGLVIPFIKTNKGEIEISY